MKIFFILFFLFSSLFAKEQIFYNYLKNSNNLDFDFSKIKTISLSATMNGKYFAKDEKANIYNLSNNSYYSQYVTSSGGARRVYFSFNNLLLTLDKCAFQSNYSDIGYSVTSESSASCVQDDNDNGYGIKTLDILYTLDDNNSDSYDYISLNMSQSDYNFNLALVGSLIGFSLFFFSILITVFVGGRR